jgi:alkylated DNA nucleotide flippase Atl1
MLRSVKTEWVFEQVSTARETKRLSVTRADGKSGTGYSTSGMPRDQLLYEANKDPRYVPRVLEEVLVQHIVPWTPEIGATGRRHVAGIKFRDELARIQALGSKATKHDLEQALELAAEALSYGPSTQT